MCSAVYALFVHYFIIKVLNNVTNFYCGFKFDLRVIVSQKLPVAVWIFSPYEMIIFSVILFMVTSQLY